MRPTSRLAALCAALVGSLAAESAFAQQQPILDPAVLDQISAAMAEKDQRTPAQAKLDSQFVLEMKRRRGDPLMARMPALEITMERRGNDTTHVDLYGTITPALEEAIRSLGGTIENSHPQWEMLRAWIPLPALETL